jgi:hypothetical protein
LLQKHNPTPRLLASHKSQQLKLGSFYILHIHRLLHAIATNPERPLRLTLKFQREVHPAEPPEAGPGYHRQVLEPLVNVAANLAQVPDGAVPADGRGLGAARVDFEVGFADGRVLEELVEVEGYGGVVVDPFVLEGKGEGVSTLLDEMVGEEKGEWGENDENVPF